MWIRGLFSRNKLNTPHPEAGAIRPPTEVPDDLTGLLWTRDGQGLVVGQSGKLVQPQSAKEKE